MLLAFSAPSYPTSPSTSPSFFSYMMKSTSKEPNDASGLRGSWLEARRNSNDNSGKRLPIRPVAAGSPTVDERVDILQPGVFPCTHPGCIRSFSTLRGMRIHLASHDRKNKAAQVADDAKAPSTRSRSLSESMLAGKTSRQQHHKKQHTSDAFVHSREVKIPESLSVTPNPSLKLPHPKNSKAWELIENNVVKQLDGKLTALSLEQFHAGWGGPPWHNVESFPNHSIPLA